MPRIYALNIVLLVFFSIITVVKNQSAPFFQRPANGTIFFPGSDVIISISYFSNVTGTLTRSCGTLVTSVSITTNSNSSYTIPSSYTGNCTLSAVFPQPVPAPQSIYIRSAGNLLFSSLSSTMAAGSNVSVTLFYSPRTTPDYIFTVKLDCNLPGIDPATALITGNITGQNFSIPQNFYGSPCVYSAIDPAGLYLMRNPPNVIITQQLFVQQPVAGQLVNYPNSFNTLITTGFVNISTVLNMSLSCFYSPRYLNISTNTLTTIAPTQNDFGRCFFFAQSIPFPYLNRPLFTTVFSIKVSFDYIDPPVKIYSGIPFPVYLNTTAPINMSRVTATALNLNCSNTLIRQWTTLFNTPTSNNLTTPIASRNDCTLNTWPESNVFNQVFVPIIVANPVISSPLNDTSYAFNGQISFTLSDASLYTSGSATQTCGSSVVTKTLNSTFQTTFDLPLDYEGTCSYSATTIPASIINTVVIEIINKAVQFVLPPIFPKQSVPAGTSFPLQLSYFPTTTTNLVFTVKLQCGAKSKTENIIGNEPSQLYLVPSDFSGINCELFVINSPDGYLPRSSRFIDVTQELNVISPKPNQVFDVDSNVLFSIESPLGAGDVIYVTITCPGKTLTIQVLTNTPKTQFFNSDYYGECSVAFHPELAFFVTPQSFDIYFKYFLTFTGPPVQIIGNIPFTIKADTSFPPGSLAPSTVDLNVICQDMVIDTWGNIILNSDYTITLPGITPTFDNCLLSPVDNDYYRGFSGQFAIIKSPVGGEVFPITEEEVQVFLDIIRFPANFEILN